MKIKLGYKEGYGLIESMNDWCYKIDQGKLEADRGFTYREFFDLFNDKIQEENFNRYIIFWFLKIETATQRAFYRDLYSYNTESYEKCLLDTNHGELLRYLRQSRRLKHKIPLHQYDSHCHILGATNSGKSTLLRHKIYRIREKLPRSTHIVLDPHGLLAKEIYKSDQTNSKNTIYLDLDFKKGWTYKLNILDIPDREDKTIRFASENVTGVMKAVLESNGVSDIQISVLQMCVNYVYSKENPHFDLFLDLLSLKPETLTDAARFDPRFANKEFTNSNTRKALEARFNLLLENVALRNILRGKGTVNLGKAIKKGGNTILFDLSGLPEEMSKPAFAKLLLASIKNMVQQRGLHEKPAPLFLWIDECQVFVTGAYEKFISEMRKFGVKLILANQFIEQIRDDYSRLAIKKQVGVKIGRAKRTSDLSTMIVPERYLKEGQLNLKKYEWIIETHDRTTSFIAPNFLLSGKHDVAEEVKERLNQSMIDKYYVKIDSKPRNVNSDKPSDFSTDVFIDDAE
ncbi:type IV secretion system DNA-binding domain-containing protein [Neolewinella aurantiaca]|nr:type IV secretion system DNA-binding domain-containing protein [Neolewinella aurantiaca]